MQSLLRTRNITEALGFGDPRRPVAFRLLWHDRRGSCAVQASTSSTPEKKDAKKTNTCYAMSPKYYGSQPVGIWLKVYLRPK